MVRILTTIALMCAMPVVALAAAGDEWVSIPGKETHADPAAPTLVLNPLGQNPGTSPSNPYSAIFNEYKTEAMGASDVRVVTFSIHLNGVQPRASWAGARFNIHWDGTEVDIDAIGTATPSPIEWVPWPTFAALPRLNGQKVSQTAYLNNTWLPARSQGTQSMNASWTAWDPQAINSGRSTGLPVSTRVPIFWAVIHVKNSQISNNSDFDITVTGQNLYHISAGSSSAVLDASNWVYVPGDSTESPFFNDPTHGPSVRVRNARGEALNPDLGLGAGEWVHLDQSMHAVEEASGFIATQFQIGTRIGIEHVPEPVTAALLLAGAGSLFVARRRRAAK